MVSFMGDFDTAKGDIRWGKRDLESSSTSIERIFKSFVGIHTNKRNDLGNEKTAKLVFCQRIL